MKYIVTKKEYREGDMVTENQIGHFIIDAQHATDVLQIESCRGADGDTGHYLVRRQRIAQHRHKKGKEKKKHFDAEKIKKKR